MAKRKRQRAPVDRIRKAGLPIGGAVPFVPPNGWHPSQPLKRGPNGGYIDRYGREWTKGRSITPGDPFEWDVQLPGGGHLNVSPRGDVTHGS